MPVVQGSARSADSIIGTGGAFKTARGRTRDPPCPPVYLIGRDLSWLKSNSPSSSFAAAGTGAGFSASGVGAGAGVTIASGTGAGAGAGVGSGPAVSTTLVAGAGAGAGGAISWGAGAVDGATVDGASLLPPKEVDGIEGSEKPPDGSDEALGSAELPKPPKFGVGSFSGLGFRVSGIAVEACVRMGITRVSSRE